MTNFIDRLKQESELAQPQDKILISVRDIRMVLRDREEWRERAINKTVKEVAL